MKKLIYLALMFCAFVQAWGHEWTDTNGRVWSFDIDGSTAINIQPTDSYRDIISGAVTIPATVYVYGTAYQVTSIASSAFRSCDQITSMTLPDGITTIGSSAFYGCPSIGSINIPASVTSIGHDAFYCNYGLQKIIAPDIAAWCAILFSYTGNPLSYAHHLYRDANTEYTNVTIPQGVTAIGDYTFQDCTGVTSINIPNSVTTIGEEAFSGCTNLTSVNVPNSLTAVGDNAFNDTPFYNNLSGMVYFGKVAYRYAGTMPTGTTIDIREGTETIAQSAFTFSPNLAAVNIPASVTTIGERAFQNCDGLTAIDIPEGVNTIGNFAFMDSENLASVTLPSTLTNINRSVFNGCTALRSVTIPEGVTDIGLSAFDGCTALTSVAIPPTVTNIGESAFESCTSLTVIDLPEGVASIDDYAFYGCTDVTSISIPASATSIGTSAFNKCTNVTVVYNFNPTPQTINAKAFACYETATLFVPFAKLEAYRSAENWQRFSNIVGIQRGDVNGDGAVDITDVVCLVDRTLNKNVPLFVEPAADLNADGEINIEDVVCLVNLLLGKET